MICRASRSIALERAEEEAVAPAMAVAAVADFVEIGVERTGRDFVQQRLPDMGAVLFDQDDVVPLAAEARAEAPHQLETAAPPPTTTICVLRSMSASPEPPIGRM